MQCCITQDLCSRMQSELQFRVLQLNIVKTNRLSQYSCFIIILLSTARHIILGTVLLLWFRVGTHSCKALCTLSVWPCPPGKRLRADDTRSGKSCRRTHTPAGTATCPEDRKLHTWHSAASGSGPVDSICLPGTLLYCMNL